jgi:hypothetical protein
MYRVLRAEQDKARRQVRDDLLPTPRFRFSWDDHPAVCADCGQPLCLRRTRQRHVLSVTYGSFLAVERQGYCPLHPQLPDARSGSWPLSPLPEPSMPTMFWLGWVWSGFSAVVSTRKSATNSAPSMLWTCR